MLSGGMDGLLVSTSGKNNGVGEIGGVCEIPASAEVSWEGGWIGVGSNDVSGTWATSDMSSNGSDF